MKHQHLAGALAIAGAISFAWFLHDANDAPLLPTSSVHRDAIAPEAPRIESSMDVPGNSRVALAESQETEIVMGIRVLQDRNCTVTRHYLDNGNGVLSEAYSCVPDETTPDTYEQYSDSELEVLAYSDAKAASTLGKRLVGVDLSRSRELLLRAFALEPANVEPVMWLASQAYSLRGDSKAAQIATANAYVITSTARALGSNVAVDWIVEDLRAAGFREEGFSFLDQSVKEDLSQIRAIQLEVFGSTTVEEELL